MFLKASAIKPQILKHFNCHNAGVAWHQSWEERRLSLSELHISYLILCRFILSVALHVNFQGMVFMV